VKPTSVKIIKILKEAGHEALWAGGCVRDMLLGHEPKDFDIATSAKPDEIENLLDKTISIGKEFGVILAVKNDHHFEVATFRSDSGYSDGRRPNAVIFTHAEEDAKRRDFTINGLFYDPTEDKIYDYVEGEKDLDAKLVRFIGDPDERIKEDHLRMLRAIRFKNVFGFQYHPDTFNAIKRHAKLISKISGERVRDELSKMIVHESFSQSIMDMEDTGLLEVLLPEAQALKGVAQPIEYHQEGDVFDHTMRALDALKPTSSFYTRWAVFFHDIGKPDTFKLEERIRFDRHAEKAGEIVDQIMRRLKFSNEDIAQVMWLVEHHMSVYNVLDMKVGRRRHWFLHPWFLELLELNRCDVEGTIPSDDSIRQKVLELYRKDLKEMPERPEKLLDGNDIMKILGLSPGPEIQKILDELHELQLEKKITTKEQALEWLQKRK
jgi:poly(A) polymerase